MAAALVVPAIAAPAPAQIATDADLPPMLLEPPPPAMYGQAELEFDEYDYYDGFFFFPGLRYDADFDDTPGISLAFGWASFEIELLHFESDDEDDSDNNIFDVAFADAEVEATAVMLNYLVDIPPHSPVSAYLGGGIGVGYYDFEIFQRDATGTQTLMDDDSDVGLALQFLAGVRFEVHPQIDLYLGGRAFWIFGDDDIYVEYLALEMGLRFYF
jgi:opacity protein-like surface antigen